MEQQSLDLGPLIVFGVGVASVIAGYFFSNLNRKKPVLDAQVWRAFRLQERFIVSHNTRLFRFALPQSTDLLGLPIGQHLSFRAKGEDGAYFMRSYTPTTSDDERGYFDLVVKVYENGKMSKHMDTLNIGDTIELRGPKGKYTYAPGSKFSLGMLAGGTGITPMLQIIRAIHKNKADKTSVSLIYANVNRDDILLKDELDAITAADKRFSVFYVLNNPPTGWKGGEGFVSRQMIEEHLPRPSADNLIMMCGPPAMNAAMQAHCQKIGYPKEQVIEF